MGTKIGIIGLGHMGLPMARHLVAAGREVIGSDVSAEAMSSAQALGVSTVRTAEEVGENAESILVVVGFDPELEDVIMGPEGLLKSLRPGSVVAVSSTVSPRLLNQLSTHLSSRRATIVDTPLVGGERAAEDGTLLIFGGGDPQALDQVEPIFRCFSTEVLRLGPLGAGQIGKALNNFLLWACTCADEEMFLLSAAYGLDAAAVKDAMLRGTGTNQVLANWGMPRGMRWAEKDMTILLSMADDAGLSMPLAGVIRERVKAVKSARGLITPRPYSAVADV